jgi:hypothetical protein
MCQQYGFSPAILSAASDALSGSTEWTLYLQLLQGSNSIERITEDDPRWPGAFAAVKRLQEQTTTVEGVSDATRILSGSTLNLPAAEDEATVNAAAVILLQTIIHLLGSDLEWVFNRVHFVCTLQGTKFNAYTDGALRSKENQRVFAILEVKKRRRTADNDLIVIQEACQIAAWLSSSGKAGAYFNDQ